MAFKTEFVTYSTGNLNDLDEFRQEIAHDEPYAGGIPVTQVLEVARTALAGMNLDISPPCRIPAADNFKELSFNNRELLVRWATMPFQTQGGLLYLIREALLATGTHEIHIEVLWAGEKKKILKCSTQFGCSPHDSNMDIDLI